MKELKKWRAHATTLLSLYIPPGRPVSDIVSMLRQELAITENIKLKRTKSKVQAALSAAIDRLLRIPKVPPNGLVVFAGENDETGEFIALMFSPPEPIKVYFYRTDKWFHVEFLESMIEENDAYGLIIIERDEATIGLLKGASLTVLDEVEGYIPGKHSRGGWSQRRFDRVIEELTKDFFKKVGEKASNYFLPLLEEGKLKGILIGGPGFTKVSFMKGNYLEYRLQKLIIGGPIDVSSQGEPGLKELVLRAEDVIKEHIYVRITKALEEFNLHLAKDDGLAIYGEEAIKKALELKAVKFIIVTEDYPRIDDVVERARKAGADVFVVNELIPDYAWIRKTFGGLVAVLRYYVSVI
ncbi:MAG: peptide chain release factor 1 [Thermoprotei archaeon]|nr:MAG: peptide chain release factor 1 [Thermoprotei archaeon]